MNGLDRSDKIISAPEKATRGTLCEKCSYEWALVEEKGKG